MSEVRKENTFCVVLDTSFTDGGDRSPVKMQKMSLDSGSDTYEINEFLRRSHGGELHKGKSKVSNVDFEQTGWMEHGEFSRRSRVVDNDTSESDEIQSMELHEVEETPIIGLKDALWGAVRKLKEEVLNGNGTHIPMLDFMLEAQNIFRQNKIFLESDNADIISIMNSVPDRRGRAWINYEGGRNESASEEWKDINKICKEFMEQQPEEKEDGTNHLYVQQKCAEVLRNTGKMHEYASLVKQGLADLVDIVDDADWFKTILDATTNPCSAMHKQLLDEYKKKENNVVRKGMKPSCWLDFMLCLDVPTFQAEWKDQEKENTRYMAAILEYWVRRVMILEKKVNIRKIAVKFECSFIELNGYISGKKKKGCQEHTFKTETNVISTSTSENKERQ